MKILFASLHFGVLRNYESAVRALSDRGHEVVLLADERESLGGGELATRLAAECRGVRRAYGPDYLEERWFLLARKLRQGLDFLRFLGPEYRQFEKLRVRARARTPRAVLWLTAIPGARRWVRPWLRRRLDLLDRALPISERFDQLLADEAPDLLVLTSLTSTRAPQVDHMRAARRRGMPTAVCITSWDRLSSKALIREHPDRLVVWNETQRDEAQRLHGIPAARVVVTGAQCYDQWFDRRPRRSREEFCSAMGLESARPFILYVGSALTPDPDEPSFVVEWIERLRGSAGPVSSQASVLVRPHPEKMPSWERVDLDRFPRVAVRGGNPIDEHAKDDYFDALYHSAAVVGLVTTAFLEAAIVGRPVLTIELPRFAAHQRGMLHFRYLLEVAGGLLTPAAGFSEHFEQLEEALGGGDTMAEQRRVFLRAFVRPYGLDQPATSRFVDAIENARSAADVDPAREAELPELSPGQRRLAQHLADRMDRGVTKWLLSEPRQADEERARRDRLRAHRRTKQVRRVQRRARQLVAKVRSLVRFNDRSTP